MPMQKNYERKYERFKYPIDNRPTIVVCGIKYKVSDISTRGVNIIVPHDSAFIIHQNIDAQFIVSEDHLVPLIGTLSILPPRYTLVFSHQYNYKPESSAKMDHPVGLEVNGFTFNAIDPGIRNIPLYVNEADINKFSRMLPPVSARLIFADGEQISVAGTIVRVKQRGTALNLLEDIPIERMNKEMQLVKGFAEESAEVRFNPQIRISKSKSLDDRLAELET